MSQKITEEVVDLTKQETGLIAYFANNSVAANLMMGFIIIMGLIVTTQSNDKCSQMSK